MRRAAALLALAPISLTALGCGSRAPDREPFPDGAAARVERTRTEPPLGTAVTWSVLKGDDELRALVPRAFASITPENDLKPDHVWRERDTYDFAAADALVDWAREQGLRVRGHTLVWHQQVPPWLSDGDWTPAELERMLTEYVRTVVGHFRGRIDTWDVVNEPFTDAGRLRTSRDAPWLGVLGPRYVALALRAARAADPRAKLFVNEIGAETGGPKLDALVRMVADLKRAGVPIDGVGLEAHLDAADPPSRARLEQTMRRLAAAGVAVEVTELDVAAHGASGERQAAVFGDVGAACAAVAACGRVTVWGVSDRDSWIGAGERPLAFDANLRAKLSWRALTGAVSRR